MCHFLAFLALPESGNDPLHTRAHASGEELHQLRPYRAGDAPRSISWKHSARRDSLLVREYEKPIGIEVILDVVFNHTCEGNEHGPTVSFKGLENRVYYMLAGQGDHYKNYSGCGNTVSALVRLAKSSPSRNAVLAAR